MLYKINCNTHDLKIIELLNKKLIYSAVIAPISIQQLLKSLMKIDKMFKHSMSIKIKKT